MKYVKMFVIVSYDYVSCGEVTLSQDSICCEICRSDSSVAADPSLRRCDAVLLGMLYTGTNISKNIRNQDDGTTVHCTSKHWVTMKNTRIFILDNRL
jgi:hypothetical protein